jgi:hypothetical protein
MNQIDDPFSSENLKIPDELLAQVWARKSEASSHSRRKQTRRLFCRLDYEEQLRLAKILRWPGLAVQAELYRLWFKAYDKTKPVELSNTVLQNLGFARSTKNQTLRRLEKAGWIKVEWRKNKSPLVHCVSLQSYSGCSSNATPV